MKNIIHLYLYLIVVLSVLLGSSQLVSAEVKPGDTMTKDNMAQAEELLTPVTRWMIERGMPMPVIETKKVAWPRTYTEATKKYAEQVKLSADGKELSEYVAGAPFPVIDAGDPLAGYKIMWNLEHAPFSTDNTGTRSIAETVSSSGVTERTFEMPWRRMMWTGRLYTDPKPVLPHNPPLRHTTLLGPLFLPNDSKGQAVLFFRFQAANVPDDTYFYAPEIRRVNRVSLPSRSDAMWGTDIDLDSYWGFNAKITYWQFRVLAEKTILAVVHGGKYGDPSAWCAPRDGRSGILSALPCVAWEPRRVWMIEAAPTGYEGRYQYAKRVLYIDQEFFTPLVQEMYDTNGTLWKGFVPCFFVTKQPYAGYPAQPLAGGKYHYDEEWPFMPTAVLVDVRNTHATIFESPSSRVQSSQWQEEWYFNEPVESNTAEMYSTNYLLKSGR
jgi:Protein of unknown function (DUF1329)